jgi:hypothetical protein
VPIEGASSPAITAIWRLTSLVHGTLAPCGTAV